MAETSLAHSMNLCLLNQYCRVGSAGLARVPQDSIASALRESYEVIAKVLENSRGRILPNLQKIKTSFELGQSTSDLALCDAVFSCEREVNLPTEVEVMSRTAVPDCGEVGSVCPGVSFPTPHTLPHSFS